jgi:co-chaperonin GroES (HSP10)
MEDLTPLQNANISNVVKKLYSSERIVSFDLDLSKCKFKKLYKDTLWVQLLDEPDADTILKGGIYRPISTTKAPYRIGKVVMAGRDCKEALVGEYIQFAYGLGSPFNKSIDGYKTILLREDQVMAVVEFEGTAEEAIQNIEDNILLPSA